MIDWPMVLKAYNRDNSADYTTRAEMLQALYGKYESATRVGMILYVSNRSVLNAMQEDGLKILSKGHRYPTPMERKLFALGDVSDLSFSQISRKLGWSRVYGYKLLRKHHIKFKDSG